MGKKVLVGLLAAYASGAVAEGVIYAVNSGAGTSALTAAGSQLPTLALGWPYYAGQAAVTDFQASNYTSGLLDVVPYIVALVGYGVGHSMA
jgi:hypothetical protein